jgi:hypothetical protein
MRGDNSMRTLITLVLITLLSACTTTPDFTTGEDCWRYQVLEEGNTGRMSDTDMSSVPVVHLWYDDLLVACGVSDTRTLAGYWMDGRSMAVRACYDPITDTIYEYKLNWGEYFTNHEKCHIKLGREHNSCRGYGIGKDESICDWDA